MKVKKNKIGCLEPGSTNYDPTSSIACVRCCIDDDLDKELTKMRDVISHPNYNEIEKIDYMVYSVKEIDGQPLFTLKGQAESYALQIGCLGYHTHEIKGKTLYMACNDHDKAVGERNKPKAEDVINQINTDGEIKWKKAIGYDKQMEYCSNMKKDGYIWNRRKKRCLLNPKTDEVIIGNYSILGYVEDVPVWYTKGAALSYGELLKCNNSHTYNMYGTNGYVACKELSVAVSKRGEINCLDIQEGLAGEISFSRLSPTDIRTYGQLCCMEWNQKGYHWNGLGCVKNQEPLTWSCIDELTTEIYDGSGGYKTFRDCYNSCEVNKINY